MTSIAVIASIAVLISISSMRNTECIEFNISGYVPRVYNCEQ